jgi:leader peptidase (prepilin peptidase)/N-methyltransferase
VDMLAQSEWPDWQTWMWLKWIISIFFMFSFGACAGSFLNVVVYRLPAGMSVVSPPSRCPSCGGCLKWYQNLPIISWIFLRGRCQFCSCGISIQYPLIELISGLIVTGLAVLIYLPDPGSYWGGVGGDWWILRGFSESWPAFVCWSIALLGLMAMLLIDARTFLIPIEIPFVITLVCWILWPLQALMNGTPGSGPEWPIPEFGWAGSLAGFGGVLGVLIGMLLLRVGVIRYSFHDYGDYLQGDEVLADYPHARREMGHEVLFLLPCLAGIAVGWLLGLRIESEISPVVSALGSSMVGWLVGGAIVWLVRILGTLAFGREAMGLGDVHLLASMGAAFGWFDPLLAFFIAPFFGLIWILVGQFGSRMFKGLGHQLPYGPHLAIALFLIVFLRPVVLELGDIFLPGLQEFSSVRLAQFTPNG